MKKGFIAMLALTVFLALGFGFSDTADAKRGGGFKSNKQSFTQNKDNTTQQSNSGATSGTASGTKATTGAGAAATTKSGGLFGGSSFMKGMMLGGLAGLLFGGMFANMGAFGEIFGLLINIAAIVAIFMVIRAAWTYVRNNKRPANAGPNYDNRNSYHDRDRRDEDDRNGRGRF
ncbi:hypothetical protein ACFP56_06130 [Paenibacillus septentrionalis]|uniref:Import inner membrane translocase subunit Tim44 n=1 Tax=Paenibacillus septentrionalis TaxID=429342 RepID=A0ABW1V118_9BACL